MGKKLVWLRKRYHDKKWKNNFFSTYFLNGTLGNKICTYCAKKSKFYALLYQKKYFLHFTMKLHFFRLYGWVRILSSETENMKQILWPFFEEIGAFFFFLIRTSVIFNYFGTKMTKIDISEKNTQTLLRGLPFSHPQMVTLVKDFEGKKERKTKETRLTSS